MARPIPANLGRTCANVLATFGVAIFVYAFTQLDAPTLRLHPTKHGIEIEIIHKPRVGDRWIAIQGASEVFSSGSLIQSDGDRCAIVHRLVWRSVPKVGVLVVRADFEDADQKITYTLIKQLVLGPPAEGME